MPRFRRFPGFASAILLAMALPLLAPSAAVAQCRKDGDPVRRPPPPPTLPLLCIVLDFADSDVDIFDATTPEDMRERFYSDDPDVLTVNSMFDEMSYGQFYFTDAGRWIVVPSIDIKGTPGDESTWQYWNTIILPDGKNDFGRGLIRAHAMWSLNEADPAFDFSAFDVDDFDGTGTPDGIVDLRSELIILVIAEEKPGDDSRSGGSDRVVVSEYPEGQTFSLDGVTFDGSAAITHSQRGSVNRWIAAHELGHTALGLIDYYAFGAHVFGEGLHRDETRIEGFTLMGRNSGHLDPFAKYLMGWLAPRAAPLEGWETLQDSESHPDVIKIENPASAGNEYFLIENRWKGDSIDEKFGLADEGILVWHIDESKPCSAPAGPVRVSLLRAGGDNDDYSSAAFANDGDPGFFGVSDFTDAADLLWNNGTPSGLGIYGFSPPGPVMEVYVDYPGPSHDYIAGPGELRKATGGDDPAEFTLWIVNTGDLPDTYHVRIPENDLDPDLEVIGLPAVIQDLPPGVPTPVNFTVGLVRPVDHCALPNADVRFFSVEVEPVSQIRGIRALPATLEIGPAIVPDLVNIWSSLTLLPGESGEYRFFLKNEGNASGTIDIFIEPRRLTGRHEVLAKQIDLSWFTSWRWKDGWHQTGGAGSCGVGGSIQDIEISVPGSWAGMSDTTYSFELIARSTICEHSDTTTAHLTVVATPESQMRYLMWEMVQTVDTVKLDILKRKLQDAAQKAEMALQKWKLDRPIEAFNLLVAADNVMGAYVQGVGALQARKEISIKEADMYRFTARGIQSNIAVIQEAIGAPGNRPLPDDGPIIIK